ncbi:hypothetical protein LSAT2_002968 [Lamellibrachia satsuma]|nr:hypothetical protein LSAT2_002968 [Lamellibrachia satsuma]
MEHKLAVTETTPKHRLIAANQSQLPSFDDNRPDWDVLVKAVYDCCARTKAPVSPSVPRQEDNVDTWCVTWLPATGKGEQKAFFPETKKKETHVPVSSPPEMFILTHGPYDMTYLPTKQTDKDVLQDVLLTCGMKLVLASTFLINACRSSVSRERKGIRYIQCQ